MTVVIRINDLTALVDGGEWTSDVPAFARMCERHAWTPDTHEYDPDPDYSAALRVVDSLGGRIVHRDPPAPTEPGRLY